MAGSKISDATKDLITDKYEQADHALDALDFLLAASADMETAYSERVANGFIQIMATSIDVLRSYTSEARGRLLELDRESQQRQGEAERTTC